MTTVTARQYPSFRFEPQTTNEAAASLRPLKLILLWFSPPVPRLTIIRVTLRPFKVILSYYCYLIVLLLLTTAATATAASVKTFRVAGCP